MFQEPRCEGAFWMLCVSYVHTHTRGQYKGQTAALRPSSAVQVMRAKLLSAGPGYSGSRAWISAVQTAACSLYQLSCQCGYKPGYEPCFLVPVTQQLHRPLGKAGKAAGEPGSKPRCCLGLCLPSAGGGRAGRPLC